jgi:kumamolisin
MKIAKGMLKIVTTGMLLGSVSLGAAATGLTPVHGNLSPLVAKAKAAKHHNPSAKLDISMALPLQNQAQLVQFLHDLQDRSSPSYHQFLKAGEFAGLYGASDAQLQAVKAFLTQRGVPAKSISVSPNRTRVMFTASTALVESAFGVAIDDYTYQGQTFYSATSDPVLPADLHVKAVFGLDDGVQWHAHNIQNLHPAPAPKGKGAGPSGYAPQQIAAAYDWPSITSVTNGANVSIAIATAFTYRTQDVRKFWSTYGLPNHVLGNVPIGGSTNSLNGETTLDIERSGAMAPGADIRVYECVNPADANFDLEFETIADNDSEQVVSTSWGLNETQSGLASIGAEHDAFVQMATQGQIVVAAAGDDGAGDAFTGLDNADFPSSDPFVVAAGGTTLLLSGSTVISETAWGGAGGADSLYFAEPAFQTGAAGWVPNTACSEDVTADPAYTDDTTDVCTGAGNASRQSSDMSMDADPGTGYSIYYNGRWEVFGGTSFVAPQLAGLYADLASIDLANAGSGLVGPGPALVFCLAASDAAADFRDITSGSNGFAAGAGWDHPTGWGVPDATSFITDAEANCVR